MATHATCPLCGKSSALSTFPSGPGNDLFVHSVQGLGKGKGFAVIDRVSALDDAELCARLKPKVVDLVFALINHGHLEPGELPPYPSPPPQEPVPKTAKESMAQEQVESELETLKAKSRTDQLQLSNQTMELIELRRELKREKVEEEMLAEAVKEMLTKGTTTARKVAAVLGMELARFDQLCSVLNDLLAAVWKELRSNGFRPLEQEAVNRLRAASVRCYERAQELDLLRSYPVPMPTAGDSRAAAHGPSGQAATPVGGSRTGVVPQPSGPALATPSELERLAREGKPQTPILAGQREPVTVEGAKQTPDPLLELAIRVIAALEASAPHLPPSLLVSPGTVAAARRLKGSKAQAAETHAPPSSGRRKSGARTRRKRRPRPRA